jgi:outer membrane protein assembly factor BamB
MYPSLQLPALQRLFAYSFSISRERLSMKRSRFSLLLIVSILAALLLSSCAGGTAYNTWPGVSTQDGVVYLSYLNGVFAIKDGNLLWRFPEKADNAKAFYAPPAFGQQIIVVGDYSNHLYGINPQNGAQNWAFEREGGHFVSSPLIVGDTILAPSSDHTLYALDLSGNERWKYRTSNILWGQPVSDGSLVFLPAMNHNLYALKLADGSVAWEKKLDGALPASPILTEDGTLYIVSLEGQVYGLDASNGAVRWNVDVAGEVWSSPVLVEDTLYIGSSDGKVYLVTAEGIQKEVNVGSPIIGGGALYEDVVVFPTEGGSLVAVNSEGQTTPWKPTVNGKLYTTPVVVGDQVVVAVKDGEKLLSAFDQNGNEVWSFTAPK